MWEIRLIISTLLAFGGGPTLSSVNAPRTQQKASLMEAAEPCIVWASQGWCTYQGRCRCDSISVKSLSLSGQEMRIWRGVKALLLLVGEYR